MAAPYQTNGHEDLRRGCSNGEILLHGITKQEANSLCMKQGNEPIQTVAEYVNHKSPPMAMKEQTHCYKPTSFGQGVTGLITDKYSRQLQISFRGR